MPHTHVQKYVQMQCFMLLSCPPHTISFIFHLKTGDFGWSTSLELSFLQHTQAALIIDLKNQIGFLFLCPISDKDFTSGFEALIFHSSTFTKDFFKQFHFLVADEYHCMLDSSGLFCRLPISFPRLKSV